MPRKIPKAKHIWIRDGAVTTCRNCSAVYRPDGHGSRRTEDCRGGKGRRR